MADRSRAERGVGASAEQVYGWYVVGQQRLAAGQPQAAAEILELAAEAEPSKASLHETLARACFEAHLTARARTAFERVLELAPSDAYAHYGVGRCLEREGELGAAQKHLKLACALYPREAYRAALDRVTARRSG